MSNGKKKTRYAIVLGIAAVLVAVVGILVNICGVRWQGRNVAEPDFTMSIAPMQGTLEKGGATQTNVSIKGQNEYGHDVNLGASGQPADVMIAFSPPFGSAKPAYTSIMTVTTAAGAPAGKHEIVIKASGADGKEHSCKYTLTIAEGAAESKQLVKELPQIVIASPKAGEQVPISTTVSGTISGDLPKGLYMWVVINPHPSPGHWWPQGGKIEPWAGRWTIPVWLGREKEDKGKEFDIAAVLVNEDGNKLYENYLKVGQQTGSYPGIPLPTGTEIISRITVKRK